MEDPPISSPERLGTAGVGEIALSSVEAEAEAEEGVGLVPGEALVPRSLCLLALPLNGQARAAGEVIRP